MPEVILAVLGRPELARAALDAAQCLATLVGQASVAAIAVDTLPPANPLAAEALMAEIGDVAASRELDRKRIASLKANYDTWASGVRQAGLAVQWREVEGAANLVVEQTGRRADLVVIARPMEDDDESTRHGFQAALFRTERPILVVPPGPSVPFGRCVAIAWRDDGRAIKAAMPALRFLAGAEQVHLLMGVRTGAAPPSVPAVFQDHRISAHLHVLPIGRAPLGQALLQKVHELGADMLVMGAYAHSPLRESSSAVLPDTCSSTLIVPVLMRH